MKARASSVSAAIVCLAAISVPGAVAGRQTPDPAALEEALRLSRTRRPSDLDTFNAPYIVVKGGPGQPKVEVITEFRRAVILGREQADLGNYTWSRTNLARAVAKYEGLTSVRAEVWLSPAHLYVGTPAYRMDLYDGRQRTVMPVQETRDPIFNAVTAAGEGSSMTGVTLDTIYRADVLRDAGCCLIRIVDPKGEAVVQKQVDFAALR
jgi:hypothetical protein